MRARNIKPGFFKNEELVKLPEAVRLLFIGLWCLADRKGRLEDRPARIKMELYPCDQHDVSTMLDQLQHGAFIMRYQVNGNRYIQIVNFEKHQYPHIREQASTIPAPCKPGASTMQARLNPDVLNPESPILNTAGPVQAPEFDFYLLWNQYPKKRGQRNALRHFQSSVKTLSDFEAIQRALSNYRAEVSGKDTQYIKNGDTWFNNWREYLEVPNAPNGRQSGVDYIALARAKRRDEESRKITPPREILAGVRDMSDVQAETRAGPGEDE